jgi:RNA 2',3'-cyclic 3'-phosphodiesterase
MRLFVGLTFPDSLKDQLLSLRTSIPGARWSGPEQIHLTLAFIGETEKNFHPVLETVQAESFTLRLNGVGRFPQNPKAPPRVLWAGLDESPALMHLQQQVVSALQSTGFQPESRPYHPHVTLAWLKADRAANEAVNGFIARHHQLASAPLPVRQFILYSSQLTPDGAIYTEQGIYPLH